MTYKQIQIMHETRMWVKTVGVAIIGAIAVDKAYPELKYKVKDTVTKPFKAAKEKFSKKEN